MGQGLLRTLDGHADTVNAVKFSPDEKHAVSCSREGSIVVWDLDSGVAAQRMVLARRTMETDWNRVLREVPNFIYDIAIVAGGKQVASASIDSVIRVWDIKSGELLMRLEGHEHAPTSLVAVTDRRVVSASSDLIILWDIATGTPVQTVDGPNHTVNALAVSPDRHYLVWGAKDVLEVRDPENLKLIRTINVKSLPDTIVVANDGLIVGASNQVLHMWNAKTGLFRARIPISRNYYDPNHHFYVYCMALLADGQHVLLSYAFGTFVCDLEGSSDPVRLTDHSVESLDVLPDDSRAITGLESCKVQYWDLPAVCRTTSRQDGSTSQVAFSPVGEFVLELRESDLVCWDVENAKELWTLPTHNDTVKALAVTPDGHSAITGSHDGTLKVFDILRPALVHELTGHTDWVLDVVVTPDGSRAISTSEDLTARVWSLESGEEVQMAFV